MNKEAFKIAASKTAKEAVSAFAIAAIVGCFFAVSFLLPLYVMAALWMAIMLTAIFWLNYNSAKRNLQ